MLYNIFIFLFVLSWLVFFHEMGHFLAAKACGIYCDRFSLGMPPRLFGMRIGETDYCIGALPIGGYVKMAGQEDVPQTDEEREKEFGDIPPERWYSNKPVWQRVIVIVAGPLMNLVLAVLLYAAVAALGADVPEIKIDNRVGMIMEDSAALDAPLFRVMGEDTDVDFSRNPDATGWKTGDRILQVNGNPIQNIVPDLAVQAVLSGGGDLIVLLERTAEDGSPTRYVSLVRPEVKGEERHAQIGVAPFFTVLVEGVQEDSPAEAAGLRAGDEILRADGIPVDRETFMKLLAGYEDGKPVDLEIASGTAVRNVTVATRVMGRFPDYIQYIPEEDVEEAAAARPVIVAISESLEEATGLKRKDIITTINGEPATYEKLSELEHGSPGETLQLDVLRPSIWYGLLRREDKFDTQIEIARVGSVGVTMGTKFVHVQAPPGRIIPEALQSSKKALDLTMKTLARLVTGHLSPRDLGGPVMIAQVTVQAANLGLSWLLEMTAFISINLCVFNLLPLPVLDGGHLVFLGIEGVRRKPLSIRVMEWVQQAGLVFIIMLLLFVTFNDLQRWITNIIP